MSGFKAGSVVRLRSGGPKMTCTQDSDPDNEEAFAHCQWFAGSKLEEGFFPPRSIVTVDENDEEK